MKSMFGKKLMANQNKVKKLYVIPHTHGDLTWADIPDLCINSCVACIEDTLKFQQNVPEFKFTMEHVLYLEEYLKRFPDNREKIRELFQKGILECGGFYTGPTELLLGGEGLVRELIYGKLWLKVKLGIDVQCVWNVDCPGHTLQLPQILRKADIKYFVIWKDFGHFPKNFGGYDGPSLFIWKSPDGSKVLCCHTPINYAATQTLGFRTGYKETLKRLPQFFKEYGNHINQYKLPGKVLIADGADIQRPSLTVVDTVRKWNKSNNHVKIVFSTTSEYFNDLNSVKLQEFEGEMPCWWDGVQVCELDRGLRDRMIEGKLLAAETFSTLSNYLMGTEYPKEDLDIAWKYRLMVNEHNWGGCNWGFREGEISDEIQKGQMKAAEIITLRSLRAATMQIAGNIKDIFTEKQIVIFNPSSWNRKDIIDLGLKFDESQFYYIGLLDSDGMNCPCQLANTELYPNGSIKKTRVLFIADVPALGYSTYKLVSNPVRNNLPSSLKVNGNSIENHRYQIVMDSKTGCIYQWFDKNLKKNLFQTEKYQGNELIIHEDKGLDECECLTGLFQSMREYPSKIYISESGPLRASIVVEGEMVGGTRRQEIHLYDGLDKVDLTTVLHWNGVKEKQVSVTYPVGLGEGILRYEVPFGFSEYGKEHPRHTKIHPSIRGVRNWVDVSNDKYGVTLATQIIPTDFKDRTANPIPGYTIQPILLRSVYSCGVPFEKGERNFYFTQEGTHRYKFSLKSHRGKFKPHEAVRFGWELNNPLIPILPAPRIPFLHMVSIEKSKIGPLPPKHSWISINQPNVIVLVFKQAEDGNGVIIRLYETDGKPTHVKLNLQLPVDKIYQTNLIEENQTPINPNKNSINIFIDKYSIETFRIIFK